MKFLFLLAGNPFQRRDPTSNGTATLSSIPHSDDDFDEAVRIAQAEFDQHQPVSSVRAVAAQWR